MNLKIKDGKVQYLYQAGKDMVSATMDAEVAKRIVTGGKSKEMTQDHPDYPLCVDQVWFFPVEDETPVPQPEITRKAGRSRKSETKG